MHIRQRIADKSPFVSLEFFPPKEREAWPKFFEVVEKLKAVDPLFVSVTYGAGGTTQDNTLEIARRLKKECGLEPLVHLTCVGATGEKIRDFLDRLAEAGIENVLALRGDPPQGQDTFVPDNEEFQHASDLVTFIRGVRPEFGVAVAGYPEAHPESACIETDLDITKLKVDAGAELIVTQLFFDNRIYFDFVERLRAKGIDAPVIPGVLPIMSLASIRRILSLCGARIPGRMYLDLEAAHEKGGNEAVRELGIELATRQAQGLLDGGAPGVHLYTLNQADACLRIVGDLRL